jgi:hypothetical protein
MDNALKKLGHIVRSSELETIMVTDHSNLTTIDMFQMRRKRHFNWQEELCSFKIRIIFIEGKHNILANLLSRLITDKLTTVLTKMFSSLNISAIETTT